MKEVEKQLTMLMIILVVMFLRSVCERVLTNNKVSCVEFKMKYEI